MSAKLTKKQLDEIDKFNNAIRGLCRLTAFMDKNNSTLDSIRRVVMLGLETNPVDPILKSGPLLKKFEEQIKARNEDFFLNGGINDELKNKSAKFSDVFNIISTNWPRLSADEKNKYWEKVDILLAATDSYNG
jgi:hypothetical protein